MARDVFLDTDRAPIGSEADLIAHVERTELGLLDQFPEIDNETWRTFMWMGKRARECLAVELIELARLVRTEIAGGVPAWRLAAVAMSYQDRLMRYKQPEFTRAVGTINSSRRTSGRQADDELAIRVLRALRAREMSFDQALQAMSDAHRDGRKIAQVDVEHAPGKNAKWKFSKSDKTEIFSESTLRGKKWQAAK